MKIIACVDNQLGLMFNHRRQSQDKVVREKIKEIQGDIYMNLYSYQLYKDDLNHIIVDENFLEKASDHYCLIENVCVNSYVHCIDQIILFCWNRNYPADFYLDIDLELFKLVSENDFKGSSHDITMKVYERK